MRVLRLEGKNGESLYRHNPNDPKDAIWVRCCDNEFDDNHPIPQNDHRLMDRIWNSRYMVPELHFAFCDKDQYLAWVYNPVWRKNLCEEAVLRVYEVPDRYCFRGDTQACFDMGMAVVVEEHSPMVYDLGGPEPDLEGLTCVTESDISRLMANRGVTMPTSETISRTSSESIRKRLIGSQLSEGIWPPVRRGTLRSEVL